MKRPAPEKLYNSNTLFALAKDDLLRKIHEHEGGFSILEDAGLVVSVSRSASSDNEYTYDIFSLMEIKHLLSNNGLDLHSLVSSHKEAEEAEGVLDEYVLDPIDGGIIEGGGQDVVDFIFDEAYIRNISERPVETGELDINIVRFFETPKQLVENAIATNEVQSGIIYSEASRGGFEGVIDLYERKINIAWQLEYLNETLGNLGVKFSDVVDYAVNHHSTELVFEQTFGELSSFTHKRPLIGILSSSHFFLNDVLANFSEAVIRENRNSMEEEELDALCEEASEAVLDHIYLGRGDRPESIESFSYIDRESDAHLPLDLPSDLNKVLDWKLMSSSYCQDGDTVTVTLLGKEISGKEEDIGREISSVLYNGLRSHIQERFATPKSEYDLGFTQRLSVYSESFSEAPPAHISEDDIIVLGAKPDYKFLATLDEAKEVVTWVNSRQGEMLLAGTLREPLISSLPDYSLHNDSFDVRAQINYMHGWLKDTGVTFNAMLSDGLDDCIYERLSVPHAHDIGGAGSFYVAVDAFFRHIKQNALDLSINHLPTNLDEKECGEVEESVYYHCDHLFFGGYNHHDMTTSVLYKYPDNNNDSMIAALVPIGATVVAIEPDKNIRFLTGDTLFIDGEVPFIDNIESPTTISMFNGRHQFDIDPHKEGVKEIREKIDEVMVAEYRNFVASDKSSVSAYNQVVLLEKHQPDNTVLATPKVKGELIKNREAREHNKNNSSKNNTGIKK